MSDLPQNTAMNRVERDTDGRLVYVTIDSTPPPTDQCNVWLVAIDGSPHSLRATAAAMRQASAMKSCALHLVNVQTWLALEAAESELLRRGLIATAEARRILDEVGQPWRLHVVMGEAAESIVGLADRLGCQGIVIGHHGQGVAKTLLLGSVAQKVTHLSALPVMVVP